MTSSNGGNVEGYLLLVEGDEARIVYCILDEGIFQDYSRMGGALLGALPLTGCKVDVFLLPDETGLLRNQFRIESQLKGMRKRGSKAPTPAQVRAMHQQRPRHVLTLAGATPDVTERWAVCLLNWNRYSWDDPQTLCSSKDEFETLTHLLQHSGVKVKPDPAPPAFKPARTIVPL